jgi:hypothetical protein
MLSDERRGYREILLSKTREARLKEKVQGPCVVFRLARDE